MITVTMTAAQLSITHAALFRRLVEVAEDLKSELGYVRASAREEQRTLREAVQAIKAARAAQQA